MNTPKFYYKKNTDLFWSELDLSFLEEETVERIIKDSACLVEESSLIAQEVKTAKLLTALKRIYAEPMGYAEIQKTIKEVLEEVGEL